MDTIGHPKTKWRDLRFKIVATVFHFCQHKHYLVFWGPRSPLLMPGLAIFTRVKKADTQTYKHTG